MQVKIKIISKKVYKKKIEDTKVVNRTRDSKKDGQYNDQKKKDKMANNGRENLTHKYIEQIEPMKPTPLEDIYHMS
jgi:hypothetical protein